MDDTIKKDLIILSVITGLLFVGTLCSNLGFAFLPSSQEATRVPNIPTTETILDPLQTAVAEKITPTETPTDAEPDADSQHSASGTTSGKLTWNGLQIDIVNINNDAWPLINAQNSNNDPPAEGMTMFMVTVRITNFEGPADEPVALGASDFQLIGNLNTVYKTFRVSCGVVPDKLDGVVPLEGSIDGNICFQAPVDEGGFQLIYEPHGSPAVYFDLPQPDTEWVPPELPPALIEAQDLTWDGLKIDIANINYDAWPLIKAENSNNDPPHEGMTMLLVTIRITNLEGLVDEPVRLRDSDFKLIGSRKTIYEMFQISCGVIPDELNAVAARENGSFEANVCFQISVDESNFQLIYEPFGSPAVYFDLPQRNADK